MENKTLRKHQSLKAVSHDVLYLNSLKKKSNVSGNRNSTSESITHLPELNKKKSITTANLNTGRLNKDKLEKSPSLQQVQTKEKSNLILNNNFIEISRDSTGIIRKSLKNESIANLVGSTHSINKENLGIYSKREKKITPQWQNLVSENDFANDINKMNKDDKLRISTKVIPPINSTMLKSSSSFSPANSSVPSPISPTVQFNNSILNSNDRSMVQSPIDEILLSSNRSMVQSPLSMDIKSKSTHKVQKNYSGIKKSNNSSLTRLNKSKSSSINKLNKSKSSSINKLSKTRTSSISKNLNKSKTLSIHKINKYDNMSNSNEKIPKKTSSKINSSYMSNSSEVIKHKKSMIKEKSTRKKGSYNSIYKSTSSIKNKSRRDSLNKSNTSLKNVSKKKSYHNSTHNSLNNSNNHIDNVNNSNQNIGVEEISNHSNMTSSEDINQSRKILSSSESLISVLNDEKQNDVNKVTSYPITSYQLGLFNWIDSIDINKRKRNSYYYTIQCYQIDKSLNPNIMKRVVDEICDKYEVLKTRFYRNNKIIDANVEAIIDEETFYNKIIGNYDNIKNYNVDFSYFEEVRLRNYPKLAVLNESTIQQFIENYINGINIFENQFKIFMFRCGMDKDWTSFGINNISRDNSNTDSSNSINDINLIDNSSYINPDDHLPKTIISIISSLMITDEISLNAIMNEIMTLYSQEERKNENDSETKDAKVDPSFEENKSEEENFTFINYAQEQKENIDKTKISIEKIKSFWRKQCTEVNNDILLPKEKEEMIEELKKNKEALMEKKEKYNQLGQKMKECETLIEKLTNDRIQLEKGNGSVATVTDPVSGEKLEISNEAKQVILKMITGSETTATIEPFLIKHEVSEHVRKSIRSSTLKIEDFASLSDKDLEIFQLEISDKRKISALIEYVRNRIRECIQGQSKVKISIERHLSKVQREYDKCVREHKKYEKTIEKITNDIIKTNSILHPPLKISHIPVMELQGVRQKSVDRNDWGEYNLYYSFMPLHLESDQNQYFQQFFDDWKNKYYKEYRVERCLRKKVEREKNELVNLEDVPLVEPDYDYLSDDDIYSSSENIVTSFYNNMPSTEAICLAIFSVLLRHISGIEKFILGIHQSQRRIYQAGDCIIGPLSNIIPIKIDLSQKGVTFYNLFADLIFSIKKSRKINADHSYTQLFDFPDLPEELPVQFEFINKEECELWRKMGLKIEDLFSGLNRNEGWTKNNISLSNSSSESSFYSKDDNSENIDPETLKYFPRIRQLWSSNAGNTFIFKLIMVEWDDDTIEGGILYSRNHFDEDQIAKWIGKFETLIENIEMGKPKVTVANLISRLYQNLRWKGSQMLISSSIQLYDKRKTLTTSLMHLAGSNTKEKVSSEEEKLNK